MTTTKTEEFKIDLVDLLSQTCDVTPIKSNEPEPSVFLEFERHTLGALQGMPFYDERLPIAVGFSHFILEEADWLTLAGPMTVLGVSRHTYTAKPQRPDPGKEPAVGDPVPNANPARNYDASEISHALKSWLVQVAQKRQFEACNRAVLKLLAHKFPVLAEPLFDKTGFFPAGTQAYDAWVSIKASAFNEEKVETETMTIRNRMQHRKPTQAGGAQAYLNEQKKDAQRLEDLGVTMDCKEKQTYIKIAYSKSGIYASNTIRGVFNKIKKTEAAYTGPDKNDDSAKYTRFTKELIEELRYLEPDGTANRGRANYVTTDTADVLSDNIEVLHEQQQKMEVELANWVASKDKKPKSEGTSEGRIKQLIADAMKKYFTELELKCNTVPPAEGNLPPGYERRKYDRYDHTRGVNFSCGRKIDDPDDYIPCKKPGPNHDPSATFQNQKGGNSKRNHLAGQFWVGHRGGRQGRVAKK